MRNTYIAYNNVKLTDPAYQRLDKCQLVEVAFEIKNMEDAHGKTLITTVAPGFYIQRLATDEYF